VELDAISIHLLPGIVYLFRPGHREHFLFDRDGETFHFWCSIATSFLSPFWKRRLNQSATSAPCSEVFQAFCSASFTFGSVHSQNARQVVNSLGLALFAEFLRMANDDFKKANRDECANRAVRYIEKYYGEHDCSSKSLKAAGCSRNALIYKFQHQLGITPSRYLWKLRVEKGLAMLMQTGLTISEISDRCGFKNPFHFSRSIRRVQGNSPRAIRQKAWK
jgi:AraC family transcriptional regulator of arabinose operon